MDLLFPNVAPKRGIHATMLNHKIQDIIDNNRCDINKLYISKDVGIVDGHMAPLTVSQKIKICML